MYLSVCLWAFLPYFVTRCCMAYKGCNILLLIAYQYKKFIRSRNTTYWIVSWLQRTKWDMLNIIGTNINKINTKTETKDRKRFASCDEYHASSNQSRFDHASFPRKTGRRNFSRYSDYLNILFIVLVIGYSRWLDLRTAKALLASFMPSPAPDGTSSMWNILFAKIKIQ